MNKLEFLYRRLKTELRYSVWIRFKRSYPKNTDKFEIIFIHIPKTAGTSIYDLIGYTYIGHVSYKWYKSRNPEKFERYFKFSVVRNPWDRLVSTFFYLKKGGNNAMDRHWAEKNIFKFDTFEDFVREWVNEKNCRSWMHFIPQYEYIYDENQKLQVDYLARFESLNSDFDVISKKLNLDHGLPHINASKRISYQSYYTDEIKNIVANVYAKDIKLFGYSFE